VVAAKADGPTPQILPLPTAWQGLSGPELIPGELAHTISAMTSSAGRMGLFRSQLSIGLILGLVMGIFPQIEQMAGPMAGGFSETFRAAWF